MSVPVGVGAFTENLQVLFGRPVFTVKFMRCTKALSACYVNHILNWSAKVIITSAKFAGLKYVKEQGKLLIVSATENEVAEIMSWTVQNNLPVSFCITGPGIVATVFELTKTLLNSDYSLVINAGIAGSFNESIQTGEVIQVTEDCFADLGAEEGNDFLHISEMGFTMQDDAFTRFFFPVGTGQSPPTALKKAKGITVNKVHGHESSIQKIREKFNPDVETMEGAAVAYVCRGLNISCIQIRSISNRVEQRDKSKWEIDKAILTLNCELMHWLNGLLNSA